MGFLNFEGLSRYDGKIKDYVNTALSEKVDTTALSTVATSGDYSDLLNKPSVLTLGTVPDPTEDPSTPGTPGMVALTQNYLYICVANNTWKKVELSALNS